MRFRLLIVLLPCLTIACQEALGARRRVCTWASPRSCRAPMRIRQSCCWSRWRPVVHCSRVGGDTLEPVGADSGSPAMRLDKPRAIFGKEHRVIFEIQVPQALTLFKALRGRAPRNHAEFMDEVIRSNRISLPNLPGTYRYRYDPEADELLVESPEN